MGLDQYAFSAPDELTVVKDDDGHFAIKGIHGEEFYWRKHAKLQAFFEDAVESGRLKPLIDGSFNCNPVKLDLPIVEQLYIALVKSELPKSDGGFFYGHQYQDEACEEYREQDIKFCAWAKETMEQGDHVYYDCWW